MNKEGFTLRAADPPARKAGPLPVRIYGFPKDAGGKGARRVRTTTSRQRIPAEERGATRRLVFVFSHIPSGGVRNVGCVRSTLAQRVKAP
jgi:hypothetical protein